MIHTEKSRRIQELEELEVQRALEKLEKYKKLFQQDNKVVESK